MFSAISAEPQFRHRLDSFLPEQPEGDTISEIVRIRNENEEEERKKHKLPRWLRRLKFPHVIEPQSKLYLLWLFTVTLAFMYNAWAIPLRAAFPYQTPDNVKYWLACDYFCDFIYFVDIILFKMRISFLNSGLKETHRTKTRAHYMRKAIFKFDCLSLLPLDFLYLIEMKVNPWCRLPRVLKIQTFWEFYSRCDHLVRSAHSVRIMRTFTYMLFLIHVETCGYYAMSVYEGIGSNSWVYNGKGNAYIRCFYLATKTATSIGNNPTPGNTKEYMFMTVYWVSGVFVFALLIGQIRDIFDASNMVKTTYTHKMDNALYYVKNMNLPKETQDRVRTWFIYNWEQQKVIDETTLMDALPLKLRKDLAIHVHFNTLSKVKLFSDCDKTLLYDLVLKLKPILYLPGDYVCKKGEIGKEMYIVSQGIVEVVGGANNSLVLATLREGSVFGEISLLAIAAEGNRRTADVRCKGFTNLFILSKIDFENAMKDYPEAHKLLKKRAKKLLRMNARIERQSQCSVDQTKIKAENIIHTPPGTPKMVKTVIQIMDPRSSFVRRLSNRSSRLASDVRSSTTDAGIPDGTDNVAFDHDIEYNEDDDDEKEDIDNAEVFYDNMLADKDWDDELSALEKEYSDKDSFGEVNIADDIINDTEVDAEDDNNVVDNNDVEKKQSNGNSSSDSGVQDTKITSPACSMNRSVSNKDSKESCFSAELGDIIEDPEESNADKIEYTASMFGDIESQTVKSKSANRNVKSFKHNSCKGGGAALLRNDDYAKSFANGFTIIIDSADDKRDDKISNSTTTSNSAESLPNYDMGEFNVVIEKNSEADNITVEQSERSQSDTQFNKDHSTIELKKIPEESSEISLEKNQPQSAKTKTNIKNGKKRIQSAGKNKIGIQSKNKLGLKLKIEDEKLNHSPYTKSTSGKSKALTNKARQQHGLSRQRLNKVDAINDIPKNKAEKDRKHSTVDTINELEKIEPRTDSVCSTRSISVAEASKDQIVDNVTQTSDQNKITCYADVHREKTLSPRSNNEEMSTLFSPEMSSPARQRKISVISIGSVLKEGRETLV
ncbi:cyclic nucleotide gated channel beta 1 [Mactra antiquata]